jgi:hypothetical protein
MKVHRFMRLVALVAIPTFASGLGSAGASAAPPDTGCHLQSARGDIKHVIAITFDNVHFTRDNPNVPSDLEQMPHLLNFIENNGTLLSNHHTPLISHTATDILTNLTGVYGDRMGVPVSNSFRYFNPSGTSNVGVSFAYWTDPLFDPTTSTPTDTRFNMLTAEGKNAPAPWVPYTRAGCNWGGVATANAILENIATDIPTVFGANSPESTEAAISNAEAARLSMAHQPPDALSTLAQTDFVGIGVHCGLGGGICAGNPHAQPDNLPDEPRGYNGFLGLFGAKYVDPVITSGQAAIDDLNGRQVTDPFGQPGFPGFDGMSASVSLGYIAAMQEHGVPVTYAYISDAHDAHPSGPAYGPGQAGYVAALQRYDVAFAKLFARLANDGIDQSNTLFVFTSDEGDHFVGGLPSPAGCDGVTTPCTYSKIGEISGNLAGLLATERGNETPFKVHSDDAPTVYITGNPARTADVTRKFERDVAALTATNPYGGNADTLTRALADPVEMKLLHMVTADPARTPTFTMFADPNYFLFAGAQNCSSPCTFINPGFAWNHGDIQADITTTWLGLAGPGVRNLGVTADVWSDHTDIRPTTLSLLGLTDDYVADGRVLVEPLFDWAVPQTLRAHRETLLRLVAIYKQINAPLGEFGQATLAMSTTAIESSASGDQDYTVLENRLIKLTDDRNAIAAQMRDVLAGAAFAGQAINEQQALTLIDQGQGLLDQVTRP